MEDLTNFVAPSEGALEKGGNTKLKRKNVTTEVCSGFTTFTNAPLRKTTEEKSYQYSLGCGDYFS